MFLGVLFLQHHHYLLYCLGRPICWTCYFSQHHVTPLSLLSARTSPLSVVRTSVLLKGWAGGWGWRLTWRCWCCCGHPAWCCCCCCCWWWHHIWCCLLTPHDHEVAAVHILSVCISWLPLPVHVPVLVAVVFRDCHCWWSCCCCSIYYLLMLILR